MSRKIMVPEEWISSPLVEGLSPDAVVFHLSALSWSSQYLTDGLVPTRALRHLWPVEDVDLVIDALVNAGLWRIRDTGYRLVAWEDHVISREKQERWMTGNAKRQERWRRCKEGDHSTCARCEWVKRYGAPDAAEVLIAIHLYDRGPS